MKTIGIITIGLAYVLAVHSAQAAGATPITVVDPKGAQIAYIDCGDPIEVRFGGAGSPKVLQGKIHESGKRKYKKPDGSLAYKVKFDNDGFKLRNENEKMLWKVKDGTPGKIKVSDNEEGLRPIVIKHHDNSISVEDDGVPLGKIRYDEKTGVTKITTHAGKVVYEIKTGKPTAAFGLLLVNRIPVGEATVLEAELLIRGR